VSEGQKAGREGSLEAPTRHALAWQDPQFYDHAALDKELERIFDICHGCRRCFNLCNSFPTLFDLIDESKTGELDGVDKKDYGKVVDHCYLCDMCYMTKCPYVPPHPWNVDFPHLMLRAKAVKNREGDLKFRDKVLSSTDTVGNIAGIPVVAQVVNAVNHSAVGRKLLDAALGVHPDAPIPEYRSRTLRKQLRKQSEPARPGGAACRRHARQGRPVRDLLRQSQRARDRSRSGGDFPAQRHRDRSRREGELLRHAQVRARRSSGGGGPQEPRTCRNSSR
jgi:glycerol-3-phosphate dehydrogenase subunit C